MKPRIALLRKAAGALILPVAVLGMSGCTGNDTGPESIVDEEDAAQDELTEEVSEDVDSYDDYVGIYNEEFYDDVEFYVGTSITLAAIVDEVVSPNVFTITSTVNTEEDVEEDIEGAPGGVAGGEAGDFEEVAMEPLLIVHDEELPGLAPGMPVGVTGVVREEFYLETVEQDLSLELDADVVDREVFGQWEERPYVEAADAASLAVDD